MTQLLVAHVKLKIILKLIKKFNPCVNINNACDDSLSNEVPPVGEISVLRSWLTVQMIVSGIVRDVCEA